MRPVISCRRRTMNYCQENGYGLEDFISNRKKIWMIRRIEFVKLMVEENYKINNIARALEKDHTTILYYLGRLKGRQPKLTTF